MNDDELQDRLRSIEQRLDAQLVWQAAVMPVLLAMLEAADSPTLQLRIVSLIEQADALRLWSMLPAGDREMARDYAEHLRSWPAQKTGASTAGTDPRGSQT